MPRGTAKSRRSANGNANSEQNAAKAPTEMVPKATPRRRTTVKREPGTATESITEQVFHRKSERRRVARDIFLVFEEQPSTRRSRGPNKKQPKPKFGHLKVEDPVKPKGLLRDIKNEPKCYLGSSATVNVCQQIEKCVTKKKIANCTNSNFKVWSSPSCTSALYANVPVRDFPKVSQEVPTTNEGDYQTAKVNPIFLWAKQDNTRIIEVRCEDYDKRNRIRITKTSNGWRAMPRSDPTSSKVLKLYTAPLIKVKRETHIQDHNHISQPTLCNINTADNKPMMVEAATAKHNAPPDPIDVGIQVSGIDVESKSSKRKAKKKKSKKRKSVFTCKKATTKINVNSVDDTDICEDIQSNINVSNDIYEGSDMKNEDTTIINKSASEENVTIVSDTAEKPHRIPDELIKMSSPIEKNCTEADVLLRSTYQNNTVDEDSSLQLCPKTGLFLRHIQIGIEDDDEDVAIVECSVNNNAAIEQKISVVDIKSNSADENNESLEAKTRNLKDLLDDADLFQNCDDNANSDAELIDTLVKSSCENNLIHNNEIASKATVESSQTKNLSTSGNDIVNEPPKCLSFNEAGEIEALNCELFQPNEYIDSFAKQPSTTITDSELSTQATIAMQSMPLQPAQLIEDTTTAETVNDTTSKNGINVIEESPKDLSYKKREEVCPPSESRSQCAVTSSSDVVKSPNLDDTAVLTSSSETLKNLILEQFIKLNSISGHQKTAVDHRKSSTVIETVVIDDDDSVNEDQQSVCTDEPLKKRLRSSAIPVQNNVGDEYTVKSKMIMIDKDPDPLTQLRLLIRNSQWKVPDPILVPKDRLSAVLASPAREIPLLITTRPELRLPEAFAYPEIIQNPNILVISMAQLEAILKNDIEANKSKSKEYETKTLSLDCNQTSGKASKYVNNNLVNPDLHTNNSSEIRIQHRNEDALSPKNPINTLITCNEESAKCSHIDSSLSSDINAATVAVLNQMLWLPYFGQISQEFMKSVKTPHRLPQKLLSLNQKENDTQHVNEVGEKKKQDQVSATISNNNPSINSLFANAALSSVLKQGHSEELTLFQKIIQHQMQNVINLSQTKNCATEQTQNNYVSNKISNTEQSSHVESVIHNSTHANAINIPSNAKNFNQADNHGVDVTGKTYNLRSSISSRQSSVANQYPNIKRSNMDNKPRLTCKSLSNLLEPEHNQQQNMTSSSNLSISCVPTVDANYQKPYNGIKDQTVENGMARVGCSILGASTVSSIARQSGSTKNFDSTNDFSKQKNKPMENNILDNSLRNSESSSLPTETNIPLWHPLFGR